MNTTLNEQTSSATLAARPPLISDAQKDQFRSEGYFILERAVADDDLQLMRDHCQKFIDKADAEMERKGIERSGLDAKGKRYFVPYCYQQEPSLGKFVFGELMAEVCRATIGGEAFLFWDQYVVKGADKDSAFSWHQDSGYVHLDCPMYLTCWIPLDDVNLENGTVSLLPYSEAGIRTVVKHELDPRTGDLVGYVGRNPGLPAIVPAGSIVAFSSYVFHRSGPNLTDKLRRVYLPQYATGIIHTREGKQQGQAVPFLKNGEIVWRS